MDEETDFVFRELTDEEWENLPLHLKLRQMRAEAEQIDVMLAEPGQMRTEVRRLRDALKPASQGA